MSPERTEMPKYLYKYQPYSIQSLDNLKNRRLWFSRPSTFNDPFDCKVPVKYDLEQLTNEDWKKAIERLCKKRGVDPTKTQEALLSIDKNGPSQDIREGIEKKLNWLINIMDSCGIACFTEKVDDLLMWSHYAQGHTGFCMEYDTSHKPFNKAFPVVYQHELPVVNPVLLAEASVDFLIDARIRTKYQCWEYEKEWRIMHKESGKDFGVNCQCLTGVYFGCKMSSVHQEVICLILKGSPTKFYLMEGDATQFAVKPKEVTYTPPNYEQHVNSSDAAAQD